MSKGLIATLPEELDFLAEFTSDPDNYAAEYRYLGQPKPEQAFGWITGIEVVPLNNVENN